MKKYLAEALGTFALVFSGCGAIVVDETGLGNIGHIGISIVFGLIIMVMIYSFGNVSGAHFNPAVTIGFFVYKRIGSKDSVLYILFQVIGAVAAALILRLMFPGFITLGATVPSGGAIRSFFMEIILTFFLMTVILNVSTGHMEKGIVAGIAIGATVALAAVLGGPVSGASMNPARSLAPAIASGNYESIWIYLSAPVAGVLISVPFFKIIQQKNVDKLDRNT